MRIHPENGHWGLQYRVAVGAGRFQRLGSDLSTRTSTIFHDGDPRITGCHFVGDFATERV